MEALSGGTNAKRRFWLIPVIFVLSAAAVLAALATVISNRHSRKDTLQLKAEAARLPVLRGAGEVASNRHHPLSARLSWGRGCILAISRENA